MSQEQVSRKSGFSLGRVRTLEQEGGNIRLSNFPALASAFGMSPEDLVKEIGVAELAPSTSDRLAAVRALIVDSGLPLADVIADLNKHAAAIAHALQVQQDIQNTGEAVAARKKNSPPPPKRATG